jgi:Ca2+-binding EF-hand superfamily protein
MMDDSSANQTIFWPMKPAVLVLLFVSATLFLARPVHAEDDPDLPIPDTNAPSADLKPGGTTYQELLQRYDTNHDGKLDENELAAAHEDMAKQRLEDGKGVGKKVRQQLLEKFDKNHNGRLDPDEREAARQYLQQHVELRQQLLLERYDKNGDGKLDDSERAAMMEDLRKMREKRLASQGAAASAPGNNNTAGAGTTPAAP